MKFQLQIMNSNPNMYEPPLFNNIGILIIGNSGIMFPSYITNYKIISKTTEKIKIKEYYNSKMEQLDDDGRINAFIIMSQTASVVFRDDNNFGAGCILLEFIMVPLVNSITGIIGPSDQLRKLQIYVCVEVYGDISGIKSREKYNKTKSDSTIVLCVADPGNYKLVDFFTTKFIPKDTEIYISDEEVPIIIKYDMKIFDESDYNECFSLNDYIKTYKPSLDELNLLWEEFKPMLE